MTIMLALRRLQAHLTPRMVFSLQVLVVLAVCAVLGSVAGLLGDGPR